MELFLLPILAMTPQNSSKINNSPSVSNSHHTVIQDTTSPPEILSVSSATSAEITKTEAQNSTPMSSSSQKPALSLFKWVVMWGTGTLSVFLILILLGVWNLGARVIGAVEGFLNTPPAEPEVDVSTLVLSQVKNVSELTTTVFAMEAVVPASQERNLGKLKIGETQLLYIAYGEIKAGIDLSQLTPNQIIFEPNSKSLTIQLPPPEILDSKIDVNRSYTYDYDRGFLNLGPDVGTDLQTLAQRETLAEILATACEEGILEEANQRAELVISQLMLTSGYETVKVEVTSPPRNACVNSKQ